MLLDILRYRVAYLHTNESPNWESCFFWPVPACVSVLRSGFPGSCCCCSCLLTNCLAVPVRCLGFCLVLLSVPGPVICCCLLCILVRSSDVLSSGPVACSQRCHLLCCLLSCPCIWSLYLVLYLTSVSGCLYLAVHVSVSG